MNVSEENIESLSKLALVFMHVHISVLVVL